MSMRNYRMLRVEFNLLKAKLDRKLAQHTLTIVIVVLVIVLVEIVCRAIEQ